MSQLNGEKAKNEDAFVPNITRNATTFVMTTLGPGSKLDNSPSTNDTIVAVTIALLAVVILSMVVLIGRAVKKRRERRQGRPLNQIPTIATSTMGTGVAAYGNVSVRGEIDWEPVENSTDNHIHVTNHTSPNHI